MIKNKINNLVKVHRHVPGHCLVLSVNGTYITPIRVFLLTVPSACLSTCSNCWSPPAGPTGTINLPPGYEVKIITTFFKSKTIYNLKLIY